MRYSNILCENIKKSGLKLDKISQLVGEITGSTPSKQYLSRLQNGKIPPAGDKFNAALAEVLDIDSTDLITAAYREKIPPDVLEKLKEIGTA